MSPTDAFLATGNRLEVPPEISGAHFFYKTETPALPQKDVDQVVQATIRFVHEHGLNPAHIEVLDNDYFGACGPKVRKAFERLQACVEPFGGTTSASVLVCEWATPHLDDLYLGEAFVSWVLHTGENPYLMQTFHCGRLAGVNEEFFGASVQSSSRILHTGDVVVFDPTTPHMAAPVYPSANQLLILLQLSVNDRTEEDRAELLKRLPPKACDHDEIEVYDGLVE